MLRVEKNRRNNDVTLSVRSKQPFFNRTFCIALLAAVGMHLFAFTLFYIAPFKISYKDSIFPPVAVASELGRLAESYALALLEEPEVVPPYLLLSLSAELISPPVPAIVPPKNIQLYYPFDPLRHSFLAEERRKQAFGLPDLGVQRGRGMQIVISGPLADSKLVGSPAFSAVPFELDAQPKIALDVRLDAALGKIIWLQPQQEIPERLRLWLSQEILGWEFEKTPALELVSGTIEINVGEVP